MKNFESLLAASVQAHGHLCPGQVVGVRMAMLGCRLVGLDDPGSPDQIKKLLVYVEIDRCAADAIAHTTGVKLGRRSLKFADYGIMAASFVNLETGASYRIVSTEEARDLAPAYAPDIPGKAAQQTEAYIRMPDSVLFRVEQVRIEVKDSDLPGPARSKVACTRCGQVVRDHREVMVEGRPVCLPCAGGGYFQESRPVSWPDMHWTPSTIAGRQPEDGSEDLPPTRVIRDSLYRR